MPAWGSFSYVFGPLMAGELKAGRTVAINVVRTDFFFNKTAANEITFCADDDRSIEPGSGKQRFDMTPPPDLPPPPGR